MSCTSCGTTFAALANINTKERAQWLDQQEPGCRCQRISISEHSPGPVDDTEILIRIVIAPYHVHPKTGSPKASALTHAESIGMSLFREGRATDNEIRAAAEQIIRNARAAALKQGKDKEKNVGIHGVLRINCGEIRSFCLLDDPEPSYCIYDTANEAAPAHADAFQRIAHVSEGVQDARRNALFDRLKGGFVPVGQFRGGLLNSLAPQRVS